ncbi:hypothetical protein H072_3762 [Dactylellina haptotyla CBS 200.50]|uniref:Uncharacterized protein n=1 Tax=Dactylellina haptotyla (strain CBS 200.50) TaxID=1284197 RepID=S8AHF6_DACHA|nr:hypothetical protein H072_3762 [Dactylellina haptotyla CBS 200.50]
MAIKSDAPSPAAAEPLAVVGFAFKLPAGIDHSDSFWKMVVNGETGLRPIPENRLNLEAFRNLATLKPKGYFIKDRISAFDAPFFSITAEEAVAMDPQQRLLLETAYHAVENAGITLEELGGSKTSVHVGCLSQDFKLANAKDPEIAAKYAATGGELSILANRLSWFFNLKGPSLSIETACSSSLVAMDLACQLLRNGETDMGIVAGSSLMHAPDFYIYLDNMGFLSPDNRCHSFDSRANGYARAEGLGVIMIKRLSDAIRDGNTIRAVIRSSGSNSDGHTAGITQPCGDSQLALIKETYQKAGLSMEPTRYCEAHGTGTILGDPIESHAIGAAFRSVRTADEPLYIGAVKANIGHLEAASGIAGVIKTILVLENGMIPPIADLQELNPAIDHAYYKLKFPTRATPWPGQGLRRASVNSFGFGGSNAHIVLDDAYHYLAEHGLKASHNTTPLPMGDSGITNEPMTPSDTRFGPYLLTFSAADRDGVKRMGQLYSDYLANCSARNPKTIANTSEILAELSIPKRPFAKPSLAFVFTGQGAQWARMGIELMKFPVFALSIDRSSKYLDSVGCPWNLKDELSKDAINSRIHSPDISQPLCGAVQIALIDLLEHINIKPDLVIGHSSGEVPAAYSKGALSHESAIRLAYYRGLGGAAAAGDPDQNGTMMSVGLGESDIAPLMADLSTKGYNDLHIGCINSPNNVTVSGDTTQMNILKSILDERGIFARMLKVACAYHSPHMAKAARKYIQQAGVLHPRPGKPNSTLMISYLTGEEVSNEKLRELDYWVNNLCGTVNFTKNVGAIDNLASLAKGRKYLDLRHRKGMSITNLLEVGPHSALKGPLRDILKTFQFAQDIQYDCTLIRGLSALNPFLKAVGNLQSSGFKPDIFYLNSLGKLKDSTSLVNLPCYPFSRSREYWVESQRSKNERFRRHKPSELLGTPTPDWHPLFATWRNFLNRSKSEWVEDHNINDSIIYPGAGMVTMAIEAMNQYASGHLHIQPAGFSLRDVDFIAAMRIPDSPAQLETQTHLRVVGDDNTTQNSWFEFSIYSCEDGKWKKNCKGKIRVEADPDSSETSSREPGPLLNPTILPVDQFYNSIRNAGYLFGPSFRSIESLQWSEPQKIQARVKVYEKSSAGSQGSARAMDSTHVIHPVTLDALLQLGIANSFRMSPNSIPTYIPTRLKRMWISAEGLNTPKSTLSATSCLNFHGYRGSEQSVSAFGSDNKLKVELFGYEMTRVSGGDALSAQSLPITELHTCWTPDWKPLASLKPSQQQLNMRSSSPQEGRQSAIEIHVLDKISTLTELSQVLKSDLESKGNLVCQIVDSSKTTSLTSSTADLKIILWDIDESSILSDMSSDEFKMVKDVLNTNTQVLWIQSTGIISSRYPSQHLIDGLSRVIRQEQSMAGFATLSTVVTTLSGRVNAICQVCEILLSNTDGDILHIPQTYRQTSAGNVEFCLLEEAPMATRKVQSANSLSTPVPIPWDIKTPLQLAVGSPGVLDSLHFVEDSSYGSRLLENEVEVEVKAVGLNFKDCLIALGALNENSLGHEISGIVNRIGIDTEGHGLLPGDRVCGFSVDGYRTFFRNKGHSFSKLPETLDFVEAAAIPINFATAWHSLRYVAQIGEGETILIHSAAGGTGQAAIQIAQYLGAKVFATVGTKDKRELLTRQYGIPEDHIFNSRDADFAKQVRHLTGGKGVDVVFNSLSGEMLFSSWESLAPFGRFVEIGKKDIQSQNGLPMGQFEKNCSFNAVDLGHMFLQRPKQVTKIVDEVLGLFESGDLRSVHSIHTFGISKIIDAFRLMQGGKSTGKIVVKTEPMATVQATLALKERLSFESDASYVIAGGFGGLGRDIVRWMAERGAKNLVLLSRSGPRTESAKLLISQLMAMGVNCITPRCDISDRESVDQTLKSLAAVIPPIKGCIQTSMVLRSTLFAEMTHKEWTEAIASKVAGTWNLHELLPINLDFFLLLSSVQGLIGSRTQGNYAAANTYLDALARHRVAQGLKAVSLQLGVMDTDGYLAEHEDEKQLLLGQNTYLPIQRPDFHALLERYCDPKLQLEAGEANLAVGLRLLYVDPDFDPLGTSWGRDPMFQGLRRLTEANDVSKVSTGKDIQLRIRNARSPQEAIDIVMAALMERLASTIAGMDPEDMDPSKGVQAYGVDSLQTMELRSWFLKYFRSDVPTFEILGSPSLTALALVIVERSVLRHK